jgi:2-keto-4-pentenoate hydratase/2-oxohepta-3-ene-1,7-dioic acid hydratase in catechol pathway
MKLLRFGPKCNEKPGLCDAQGMVRDLSGVLPDLTSASLGRASLDRLASIDPDTLPLVAGPVRFAPIVADIGKLICVGLNYSDHAAESGMEVPSEPVLFTKATSAIIGCNDPVVLPRGSVKSDWEVELGVVIGTRARYVEIGNALDHVAGYCVVNDLSEREYQLERGGQWDKGKGCDTFGPVGPWLVTADEVPDPQNLAMWLDVNGQRMQTGNTKTMIFSIAKLVSYVSFLFTLKPGDVVTTGTPPGVGMGMKPNPVFLKNGDVMRQGIDGLGEQRQQVVGG